MVEDGDFSIQDVLADVSEEINNETVIEELSHDGFTEYVLRWQESERDDFYKSIILSDISDTGMFDESYPPQFSVEYSAWIGGEYGPAEAQSRGAIADIFEVTAVNTVRESVVDAKNQLQSLTDTDLEQTSLSNQ